MQQIPYLDRADAGQQLAKHLLDYRNAENTIVVGLPRGGVPVASEIAKRLNLPLDIMIVRKLGAPKHVEYAIGAIASGGVKLLNQQAIIDMSISDEELSEIIDKELEELTRREFLYRKNQEKLPIKNQTIILVDDGIATGFTMHAAIMAIKKLQPKRLVMAVPVASMEAIRSLETFVDELICPIIPQYFYAVGSFYENFNQTSDEQVKNILMNSK